MITITNNKFLVSTEIDNQIERNLFSEEATAQDIVNWINEKQNNFNNLKIKLEQFKEELVNKEWQ